MKTFVIDVRGGGFDGLPFSAASVGLPDATINRIVALAAEVVRLDVYKVQLFDYRATPLKEAEGEQSEILVEADVRTECDCMNVARDRVFWSGYIKHSEDRWETDSISLDQLRDAPDGLVDLREDSAIPLSLPGQPADSRGAPCG